MGILDGSLVRKLHTALRNNLWEALMRAVEREMENQHEVISENENLYDVEKMDAERLREMSSLLGVTFDASIDDSDEFLREEVRSIPFKIRFKSTILLYRSFFRALGRRGEISIYFFRSSSDAIVRSMVDPLQSAVNHDPQTPFVHRSSDAFTGYLESALQLDTDLTMDTDIEEDIWTLDTVETQISTNHISMEFFIDRLITKEVREDEDNLVDKEFLMTWEYQDFVNTNVEFGRRVKEVPHIGSQLSVLCDNSQSYNPLGGDYTIEDIGMKALTLPEFDNLSSELAIAYIEFGIGARENLRDREGNGDLPESGVETRVARNYVLVDEKWTSGDWFAAAAEYRGQEINRFNLHDGDGYVLDDDHGSGYDDATDGSNTTFRGTLPFAPLQKGNIEFQFLHNELEYTVKDDRQGRLKSDNASGTIDYNSGEYELEMDFIRSREETIFTGDGEEKEIFEDYPDLEEPLEKGEVYLRYNVGDRWYIVQDDGDGNLSGDHIVKGDVDYDEKSVDLEFDEPITDDTKVELRFKHRVVTPPDDGSVIRANFFFTIQTIEITEAALYDEDDNILAYATFPPVEFNSSRNHLSFLFVLKQSAFA